MSKMFYFSGTIDDYLDGKISGTAALELAKAELAQLRAELAAANKAVDEARRAFHSALFLADYEPAKAWLSAHTKEGE